MPDTDLNTNGSSDVADTDDPKSNKSVDYEAKYRGLSRKYSKIQADHEKLQELFDSAQAEVDLAKAQARNGSKDLEKQMKQLQADLDAATNNAKTWESKVKSFETEKAARKTLSEKFPQLVELHDSGDLKLPDQFEKPEDYEAYLTRLASKLGAQPTKTQTQTQTEDTEELDPAQAEWQRQRQRFQGATPNVNLSDRKTNTRTLQEIDDDMWSLNTDDKDYPAKYIALENERNAVEKLQKQGRF